MNKLEQKKYNNNSSNKQLAQDVFLVDLRIWMAKILSYWWLFILSLAITVPAGYLYLRYTTYKYSTRAILLIKDAGRSGGVSEANILFQNQALLGGDKSMDNEIEILSSLTLMELVIADLKANVSYFRIGQFRDAELYNDSPLRVDSFSLDEKNIFGTSFLVEVKNNKTFNILNEEDETKQTFSYGVPFTYYGTHITLSTNPENSLIQGVYRLVIRTIESTAQSYKSRLDISRIGDQNASSVLSLSLEDAVPDKARDVLNKLIEIYNDEEIKDENRVLQNTIAFIDERVEKLQLELDSVESGIQYFKSSNEIITGNAASSMGFALGETRSAIQTLSDLEVKKNILASLGSIITDSQTEYGLIPTNLVAGNPVLSGFLNEHNQLILQRDRLAITATEQNPTLVNLKKEIEEFRKIILTTIKNLQEDLKIPTSQVESNIRELKRNIKTVPFVEQQLLERTRTQSIKENLFLYLLQRREETALSAAVTTANTRIIDRARSSNFPIYPQKRLIHLACFILGILLPLIFIALRSLFETRLESEEMLKRLTSIPILGRIGLSKEKNDIVVNAKSRSAINEMFRLLRTNLNYLNLNTGSSQTLLISSAVSGEGKSFVTINLGITLALSNKKTIILGMDLRKPKLYEYLGAENNNSGFSNYVIGKSELKDIVKQHTANENLFYITSGPIPPNPSELILSERTESLLKKLAEEYDYVLIDTPPVGLVSDALLLRKFVNNILIVVRHNYTKKIMLRNLEEMYQRGDLENANIILNGIKQGRTYYGYGGYQETYGQGYYDESTNNE